MRLVLLPLATLILLAPLTFPQPPRLPPRMPPRVPGEAQIRFRAGPSDIVVTTTLRVAGAIHSLTWGGAEFVDSSDHGRQIQSACSFDAAQPGEFWAERYNPTEAGGRRDGAGPRSSSQLLFFTQSPSELVTTTRMAFWLAPGEQSSGRPALNRQPLSNHLLTKVVSLNAEGHSHAMRHQVSFTIPPGERHMLAQYEALTGYLPANFSVFETFNPQNGQLAPLSDGPGEQPLPVVMSVPGGSHAIGCYSRDLGVSYGRWRFTPERVVKWNVVARERANPILAGTRMFMVFTVIGSRANVRDTLAALAGTPPGR